MIEGIHFIDIATHSDERGFFREILRIKDIKIEIGQISHSLVRQGVVKAWHGHKMQSQLNYVVNGLLSVVLYDNREYSTTKWDKIEFMAGDNQKPSAYIFPPGVFHGYKCIQGPMNIIYITSDIYDPEEEMRIENDVIEHNWEQEK